MTIMTIIFIDLIIKRQSKMHCNFHIFILVNSRSSVEYNSLFSSHNATKCSTSCMDWCVWSFGSNILWSNQHIILSYFDDKFAFSPISSCLMGEEWKNDHSLWCNFSFTYSSFYKDPFSIPSVLPSVPKILALPYCSSHFLFILQDKSVPHLHPNI